VSEHRGFVTWKLGFRKAQIGSGKRHGAICRVHHSMRVICSMSPDNFRLQFARSGWQIEACRGVYPPLKWWSNNSPTGTGINILKTISCCSSLNIFNFSLCISHHNKEKQLRDNQDAGSFEKSCGQTLLTFTLTLLVQIRRHKWTLKHVREMLTGYDRR
jgi:hypothetical protein